MNAKSLPLLFLMAFAAVGCSSPYFEYAKATKLGVEYRNNDFYDAVAASAERCGFLRLDQAELKKSAMPPILWLRKSSSGIVIEVGLGDGQASKMLTYLEVDKSRSINEGPSLAALEAFGCVRQELAVRYRDFR